MDPANQLAPWVAVVLFVVAWTLWWLFAVNWSRAWAVLAEGAWAPVVLLVFTIALVWAALAPAACTCVPGLRIPNFWWQLLAAGGLTLYTFCCGWLQAWLNWTPPAMVLEPPAEAHDHLHFHGHADHGHHEDEEVEHGTEPADHHGH